MKTYFRLLFTLVFLTCLGSIHAQGPVDCPNQSSLFLSTGVDPAGNQISPGSGVVDPFWRLINNPPLYNCTNPLEASINGSAYVVAFASLTGPNAWTNQPGVSTLSPINGGTSNSFGCNNLRNANGQAVPYIFERPFCVDKDTEVDMNLTFKGDDRLDLELVNLEDGTVLASNGTYIYQNPPPTPLNLNYNGPLAEGCYAIRAYLSNTNSVTLGFSVSGTINAVDQSVPFLNPGACCEKKPALVVTKILDLDCDNEVDVTDSIGQGWQIEVLNSAGSIVESGITDVNGNFIVNIIEPGTYTIREVQQSGWKANSPAGGSMTVSIEDGQNQFYFFNCPSECGEVIRDTLDYACGEGTDYQYTFHLQNNTAYDVTAVLIRNFTPSSASFSPNSFNLFNTPILAGNSTGPVQLDISFPSPITQPTEICFEVIYLAGDFECCKFTHCVTILPPDPCEKVSVSVLESTEECCYTLELVNDFCPDYFTSVITEVITPGVVFGSYNNSSIWTTGASTDGRIINWRTGATLPLGTLPPLDFCLDSVNNVSQLPQEVVVRWMRGREVVCSDTLTFECNPCAYFTLGDYECNQDGSITYSFSINNTSGRDVTDFFLQSQDPNIQINPAFVSTTIMDGDTYNGTFTISTIDGSPLSPGAILNFKLTLFDETDWCCHMNGLSLEIPDCKGCECGDEEAWLDRFNQGVDFDIDCERKEIIVKTGMTECDSILVSLIGPQGVISQTSGSGTDVLTFSLPPNGNYFIEFTAVRYDANGEICFRTIRRIEFEVDCPPSKCDCENGEVWLEQFAQGIEYKVDCDSKELQVSTGLTECDSINVSIIGPNGVIAQQSGAGNTLITIPLPANGVYLIEISAFRFDDNGEICLETIRRLDLEVDCPEDCCGEESDFINTVNAGYTIDVTCNGFVEPNMNLTPVSATECDRIIWRILGVNGEVIASDTSFGNASVNFFIPDIPRYRLQTEWTRLDENGEPCFGIILKNEDLTNPCNSLGPINVVLGIKNKEDVIISWEVETPHKYEIFYVVRTKDGKSETIHGVEAKADQARYSYVDAAAEAGENEYSVFGYGLGQTEWRQESKSILLQTTPKLEIKLTPNPALDHALVSLSVGGEYNLLIRASNGKVLERQQINVDAGGSHYLDLSNIPGGILFVQLIDQDGNTTSKRLVRVRR